MTTTMALEDVLITLPELIDRLMPGDEVVLTRNRLAIAKIVSESAEVRKARTPGSCKGMITLAVRTMSTWLDSRITDDDTIVGHTRFFYGL